MTTSNLRQSGIRTRRARAAATATGAALVLHLIGAASAAGHTAAELRGGYYTDVEEGFLGGGLLMSVGNDWDFNPNLEWVFVGEPDYFTVNADFHRDLNPGYSGPAVWLGGGPALIVVDRDTAFRDGDTDTDLGLNLIGGLGAKTGAVRPFGQLKFTLSDNSETSLAMGLRF